MRAGLSTIQQTLSPEAAVVLSQSISEAVRRRHAQTTPLHVAATLLLSSPSGRLREACVRSLPAASSHPLQGSCRALELCFSVALDRLPSSASPSAGTSPPVSNALMAALKRAQASQRRGCPEQLQQPLLAIRVELEQLLLSILDDPSVSRVMREASFSSVAVKAALEQSLATTSSFSSSAPAPPQADRGLQVSAPRLQAGQPQPQPARPNSEEEAGKVVEVFSRSKKRNPILVGESGLDSVVEEALRRIRRNEAGEELWDARVVNLNLEEEKGKERRLGDLIESHLGGSGGGIVIVNLGDLRWLLEGGGDPADIGQAVGGGGGRVRLIGTANCATYLRLQVHHPTVEVDWDLQAVPITINTQPYPRGNGNGILTSSIGLLASSKDTPLTLGGTVEGIASQIRKDGSGNPPPPSPLLRKAMCSSCAEKYREESKPGANLPPWLRAAVPANGTETTVPSPQTREAAFKKWKDRCLQLHPHLWQLPTVQAAPVSARPDPLPVKPTDLALGRRKPSPSPAPVVVARGLDHFERKGDLGSVADADGYKRLLKSLTEAVSWQRDAASEVALAVTRWRSGNGGRRPRSDTWLLLMGPDKVGKRRMASALSGFLFSAGPVAVGLAGGEMGSRGRTAVDRLAEALRRNPFAVFLVEDVDGADALVQGSLRRAAERGRLTDSHGREVPLSTAVLVLTSTSLPEGLRSPAADEALRCEDKLEAAAGKGCRFELVVGNKRPPPEEVPRYGKQRKVGRPYVSLDLNLAVGAPEEVEDEEGLTSSDLTWESGQEQGRLAVVEAPAAGGPPEWMVNAVDLAVAFQGVDFGGLRKKVADGLAARFEEWGGGGSGRRLEVEEEVLDCVVGSVWFGGGSEVERRLEEALAAGVGVGCEGCVVRLAAARGGWSSEAEDGGRRWRSREGPWLGVEM